MRLIVGLGNPGPQYEQTRHNLGFMTVGALAEQHKVNLRASAAAFGLKAASTIGSQTCFLLLPTTHMNNSGLAVQAVMAKSGVAPEDLLIVYDDMALGFGHMRLRPEGGDGGHNGIKSIIAHVGTKNFARLRLGVGRPRPGVDAADYVLSNFTGAERKCLPDFINQALLCVHSWVSEGVEQAMNRFNQQRKNNG